MEYPKTLTCQIWQYQWDMVTSGPTVAGQSQIQASVFSLRRTLYTLWSINKSFSTGLSTVIFHLFLTLDYVSNGWVFIDHGSSWSPEDGSY